MTAPHSSADTPVMRQFLEVKARHPDAIVMFRMGDFYEMFFDDAVAVAPILDIALTSRDRDAEDPVPMAGVPYHAVGGYLRTLVERGMKVAICEQMETPEEARKRRGSKIVHREVVRVVTPGVLVDDEHLRGGEPNYLVAVVPEEKLPGPLGIAALDVSSGEFWVTRADHEEVARAELARLAPAEIIAPSSAGHWLDRALAPDCPRLELCDLEHISPARIARVQTLASDGGGEPLALVLAQAAALALGYAEETQPGQTLLLHRIRRHELATHLVLDETSLRNLEVFRTMRDGKRKGSLLWAVDATRTAMGARLLRRWLGAPSRDRDEIARRQEGIAALLAQPSVRAAIQSRLQDIRDVLRLASRARLGTIHPRELGALRDSLTALPELEASLADLCGRRTDASLPEILDLGDDLLGEIRDELVRFLVDAPPTVARDGGIIRDGADPTLDHERALRDGGREALAAIETRERERTGITSLKVQHNRVFGYYLEVSRTHLARVPDDYVRKQTLANAERFVTEELAHLETKVLGAQSAALVREHELFRQLRDRVSAAGERMIEIGERIARIDVMAALAEVAERQSWVRPRLVDEPVLEVEEGRHAVVERMLGSGRFVPNDVRLSARGQEQEDSARVLVVTGPNMGGKSTIMRQTALIAILAHVGSWVPAASATVGLVDRVFTRVGATDDLGRGESTFMIEMRESAQILAHASERSLVLLDEIGRGTATFDGLALAWSIAEFLHDQIGCRSMFATHYHELCALEGKLAGVRNVHVTVHEDRGKIVFLHRLAAGPAGRSYGIQVGRLAGLPARVLRRASRILERLEAQASGGRPQLDLFAPSAAVQAPEQRASPVADEILTELGALDVDALSPRQAHALLEAWIGRLRSG